MLKRYHKIMKEFLISLLCMILLKKFFLIYQMFFIPFVLKKRYQ
ncbi:hypothetical protein FEM08_28820 [Flavobacterium gilvum]|nr:hypothetical protein FEM08_28820 [Flavobacterium gilvum]